MKKMVKKGFTLVELLFVMAIIAILAGFAIANLKDSTKVATENSMKNDARNVVSSQLSHFALYQSYDDATGTFATSTNGIIEGTNGTKFTVSKGNSLTTESTDCGDGTLGYTVDISNPSLPDSGVSYNSCTDGTIQPGAAAAAPSNG